MLFQRERERLLDSLLNSKLHSQSPVDDFQLEIVQGCGIYDMSCLCVCTHFYASLATICVYMCVCVLWHLKACSAFLFICMFVTCTRVYVYLIHKNKCISSFEFIVCILCVFQFLCHLFYSGCLHFSINISYSDENDKRNETKMETMQQ